MVGVGAGLGTEDGIEGGAGFVIRIEARCGIWSGVRASIEVGGRIHPLCGCGIGARTVPGATVGGDTGTWGTLARRWWQVWLLRRSCRERRLYHHTQPRSRSSDPSNCEAHNYLFWFGMVMVTQ